MPSPFDPYQAWLSIPPAEQPPHHYRLLGLELFEQDVAMIARGAEHQTAIVHALGAAEDPAAATKVAGEIAAARECLLDADRKLRYDAVLKSHLDTLALREAASNDGAPTAASNARSTKRNWIATVGAGVAVAAVAGIAAFIFWPREDGVVGPIDRIYNFVDSVALTIDPNRTTDDILGDTAKVDTPAAELPPTEAMPEVQKEPSPANISTAEPKVEAPAEPALEGKAPAISLPSDDDLPVTTAKIPVRDEDRAGLPPASILERLELVGDQRVPLPTKSLRDAKLEQMRIAYAVEQAKTPEQKRELAAELMQVGRSSSDNVTARFARINLARELASQAGDANLAVEAALVLQSEFELNTAALFADTLASTAQVSTSAKTNQELLSAGLHAADALIEQNSFAAAADVINALEATESIADNGAALATLKERRAAGTRKFEEMLAAKSALTALKVSPDDAAANLAAGRFLVFVDRNWHDGLPLLAKGSDVELAGLAKAELEFPEIAIQQASLAGDWDKFANQARDGSEKRIASERAAGWYAQAIGGLSGIAKARAEQRLEELKGAGFEPSQVLTSGIAPR